ncbi:MAG TPA: exopolysaccharide biosynthesis polyprenyl glycosylphosphotransferase [Acidocella sp.]|jgi:Undecaprenyl-phosphate glucose phosphotransferase|nr:exopolysaccharide biosynthesis polyprenyl glycosylphosphotransferase [Acidocella sp.]
MMNGDTPPPPHGRLDISTTNILPGALPAPTSCPWNFANDAGLVSTTAPERRNSVRVWLIKWINHLTVIGATCVAAWISDGLLSSRQSVQQALPDLVTILLFFLASPTRQLPHARFRRELIQQLRSIMPALMLSGLIQAAIFKWLGWSEPALLRTTGIWMTTVATALIFAHGFVVFVLNHPSIERRLTSKIAIIGYDSHAVRIAERLSVNSPNRVKVAGIFCDDIGQPEQIPVDGSIDDLIRLSRKANLDGIIIAFPPALGKESHIPSITWRFRSVPADIFVTPYLIRDPDMLLPIQTIGSLPFVVLERRPLDEWQMLQKKAFDIVLSLVALIPFLILFVIVAAAIKLDSPGPVLFRQPRNGLNNQQFMIFKFRSMDVSGSDLMSVKQTSRDDPRVTRVGRWLRKLSIDELPQLLNVLRGEMSLVGPRPHAPQTRIEGKLLHDVLVDYIVRLKVKPGITGWAQVNGARGELTKSDDLRRRVAYDLEYIQRWSIGFDLKIIALTVMREIVSKHAF